MIIAIFVLLTVWALWVTYELINLTRVCRALTGVLRGIVSVVRELADK